MPAATFLQPSFLGGEWSPEYQGRIDDAHYKIAMNISINGFPVEQGPWKKRSGFRRIAATQNGSLARLYAFNLGVSFPFETEWSENALRIFAGDTPVLDSTANLISFTATSPMTIFVDGGGNGWATGDTVVLVPGSGFGNQFGSLPNQQLRLTALGGNQFSLTDPQTGANIDGSQIDLTGGLPQATIGRILVFGTPYTDDDWYNVFPVMFDDQMFVFHQKYPPYVLTAITVVAATPQLSTFAFTVAPFNDGPYLDPVVGQTATVSDITGVITVTFTNGFGPNQSVPTPADVGRVVRLLNEPNVWDSGTSYAGGVSVSYGGLYYVSTFNGTTIGSPPDATPAQWAPNPDSAAWVWGVIESYVGPTQVTVQLEYDLLYNNTINTWRLGALGDPLSGYPLCGAAHEDRLWMFAKDTMYSTQSGSSLLASPTLIDGTVTDANAITYTLQSGDEDANIIQWAITSTNGMVLGTGAGEWIVKASQLDDPLTPTSIQARRVTKYRVYAARPVATPLAIVFVQKYQRKVMEFLADVFTGRYVAPNLSSAANHVSLFRIEELAYQEETFPCVWTRDLEGNLAGCTYRRNSAFITEAPAFVGWHRHTHGQTTRNFQSISMSPSPNGGVLDSLYVTTQIVDGAASCQIERMTKTFELSDTLFNSWFLDNASVPSAVYDQGTGIKLYGFYDKAGQTVTAWLGGQDLGTYTVDAQGAIVVPYTTTFTQAFIQGIGDQDFGEAGTQVRFAVSTTPARSPNPQTMGNFSGSLTPASGSAPATNYAVAPNYASGIIYTIAGTNGSADSFNIQGYNLTSRGGVLAATNANTLNFTNLTAAYVFGFDASGNLLIAMDNNNVQQLQKVAPDLTPISSFGTSGGLGFDYPNGPGHVNQACAVGGAAGEYLLALTGIPTLTTNIDVIDTGNMVWSYGLGASLPTVNPQAICCSGTTGQSGSGFILDNDGSHTFTLKEVVIQPDAGAVWYALAATFAAWDDGATYSIGDNVVYNGNYFTSKVNSNTDNTPINGANWSFANNPYISLFTHGTITPADVDATWTTMEVSNTDVDIGYDQTDGNLIMAVMTADAVTHTRYLIKVSAVNADVLWATPVSFTNLIKGLGSSRITGGRLGWAADTGVIYVLNTIDGSIATTITPTGTGIGDTGAFTYDAVTGVLYSIYNYDASTSGAPTQLSGTPSTFHEIGVYTPGTELIANTFTLTEYPFPAIAGFVYNSYGQTLRPLDPQEAGAANGPALGKKRRVATYGALLSQTQALQIGTDFTHLYAIPLQTDGGTPYPITSLFSGVVRNTLGDDSSFDGMIAWASTGPYPATVVAVQGFLTTYDE